MPVNQTRPTEVDTERYEGTRFGAGGALGNRRVFFPFSGLKIRGRQRRTAVSSNMVIKTSRRQGFNNVTGR